MMILLLQPITSGYQCTNENTDHMRCSHLHTCQSCVTHAGCHWNSKVEVPVCISIANFSTPSYDLKVSGFIYFFFFLTMAI